MKKEWSRVLEKSFIEEIDGGVILLVREKEGEGEEVEEGCDRGKCSESAVLMRWSFQDWNNSTELSETSFKLD